MKNTLLATFFMAATTLSCGKLPDNEVNRSKSSVANAPRVRFEKSIATFDPMGVNARIGNFNTDSISRVGEKTVISTTAHGWLRLDDGGNILLDNQTSIIADTDSVSLKSGRIWLEVKRDKNIKIRAGSYLLESRNGAFDVEIRKGRYFIHHLRGEVNVMAKKPVQLKGGTFELTDKGPLKVENELWVDWTGGFSRPMVSGAGYGILKGKNSGNVGVNALILRKHSVSVRIKKRVAITEIKQTFFNPVSYTRDGEYRVQLPVDASILEVELRKGSTVSSGYLSQVQEETNGYTDESFYMLGGGNFGAELKSLPPSSEVELTIKYAQKLPEEKGRRLYSYLMKGGQRSGDFELSMRIEETGAKLRSGWGGIFEKRRMIIRRNDFTPGSDFVAEIYPDEQSQVLMELPRKGKDKVPFMLSIPMSQIASKLNVGNVSNDGVNMVMLLDLSASLDSGKIQMLKTGFASVLEKFRSSDKLAVYVLRNDIIPLDGAGLASVSSERIKKLSENLSRMVPGGATDLGKALEKAAVVIPGGEGTILYIGDGNPSRGAMLGEDLKTFMSITDPPPVFRGIILGENHGGTSLDVLGKVYTASTVRKMTGIINGVIEETAASSFKEVRVLLGNKASKITPVVNPTLGINQTHYVSGFISKPVPKDFEIQGWIKGKKFSTRLPLKISHSSDSEIIERMWAYSRVDDLISQGSGKLSVSSFAMENKLVTPLTAMHFVTTGVVGSSIRLSSALFSELPSVRAFHFRMIQNRPPSEITGLSLPDIQANSGIFNMSFYYSRLLNEKSRKEAVVDCYNRKALFMPSAGGSATYEFEVEPSGRIKQFKLYSTTITDQDVLKCIDRALKLMPDLVAMPSGNENLVFRHIYSFKSTGQIVPVKCSKISRSYIEVRRRSWLSALGYSPRSYTAEQVFRKALNACEISDWISKKALLDVILDKLNMSNRLAFASLISDQGWVVKNYVKEKIFRSIKSVQDSFLVARHFNLGGSALVGAVKKELVKLDNDKEFKKLNTQEKSLKRMELIAKFHRLEKDSVELTLMYIQATSKASRKDLSSSLVQGLLWRKDLTSGQRVNLAEYLMENKMDNESKLVISTLVELAPYDPLTRKKLGDFFYGHGLFEDALSDYKVLKWLLPRQITPEVLLAQTRIKRGETELGLRIFEKLMLSNGDSLARHLLILNLAMIQDQYLKKGKNISHIRARVRRNGLLEEEGSSYVVLEVNRGTVFIQSTNKEDYASYHEAVRKKVKPEDLPVLSWDNPGVAQSSLGLFMFPLKTDRVDMIYRVRILKTGTAPLEPDAVASLKIVNDLWRKNFSVASVPLKLKHGVTYFYSYTRDGKFTLLKEEEDKIPEKKKEI
ncbi:MAG: FecR domain-containing protein [Deltaproteobacteria bacterium]|nr:FecR domain-containing protein [Deltaproteobacteria bacterium]